MFKCDEKWTFFPDIINFRTLRKIISNKFSSQTKFKQQVGKQTIKDCLFVMEWNDALYFWGNHWLYNSCIVIGSLCYLRNYTWHEIWHLVCLTNLTSIYLKMVVETTRLMLHIYPLHATWKFVWHFSSKLTSIYLKSVIYWATYVFWAKITVLETLRKKLTGYSICLRNSSLGPYLA